MCKLDVEKEKKTQNKKLGNFKLVMVFEEHNHRNLFQNGRVMQDGHHTTKFS
jgi:hypothetical protein